MGGLTRREIELAALVLLALALWIFAGAVINATTVAIAVIAMMVIGRVVTWDDILANKPAWNTLVWFATLVALARRAGSTSAPGWSFSQAARKTRRRAASSSVAISASAACVSWKSAMGLPNCTRVVVRAMASSSARRKSSTRSRR